jgi:hypothetical protein
VGGRQPILQLLDNLPTFYGTRRLITAFTEPFTDSYSDQTGNNNNNNNNNNNKKKKKNSNKKNPSVFIYIYIYKNSMV